MQKQMSLKWDESWSTGVEEFDADHKHLVGLYNNLFAACFASQGPETVLPIVQQLIDYTDDHFKREEELFENIDYPGQDEHIAEHVTLCEQLHNLQEVLGDTSKPLTMSNATLAFVKEWIEKHTKTRDCEYGPLLKSSSAD